MDAKDLTEFDIRKFEQEIAKFEENRKSFLAAGLGCIGGGITALIVVSIMFIRQDIIYMTYFIFELLVTLFVFTIFGGITFLILRSALYNNRINNRKRLIAEAKRYQEYKENLEQN